MLEQNNNELETAEAVFEIEIEEMERMASPGVVIAD